MEAGDSDGQEDLQQEVQRLRQVVRRREQEIVELRSQLDKYQSVFSFAGSTRPLASPLSPRAAAASKKRTRPRLLGISAEPAPGHSSSSSSASRDLATAKTFPKDDS